MVERIVQNDPTLLSTFMSLRRNSGMTPHAPYLFPTTPTMTMHHQNPMSHFDYAHSHQNLTGTLPPRSSSGIQLHQRSASSTPTSFATHMNSFMPTSVMRQMYRDP